MKWGIYDKLRPAQIEEIQDHFPIAYLPWGAIEYHGKHNPTGLDTHKANHLCNLLAKNNGGLVFPAINLAANLISSYHGVNFPKHSIEFSEKVVKLICEEYFEQLVQQNFKIIILLSGHAGEPHLQILKDVATKFNKKYPNHYFWALAEFDVVPNTLLKANHSALGETSLQLVFEPQTVALDLLPKEGEITLTEHAVSGADPRKATIHNGQKIINIFLEKATQKIEKLKTEYL